MLSFTVPGVAIGVTFFLFRSSVCIIEEYTSLYLKQIGYSATHIGLAPILGLFTQTVGIPSIGYLADKYRARKLFLCLSVLVSIPSVVLFLAAPVPEPICDQTTKLASEQNNTIATTVNVTSSPVLGNSSTTQAHCTVLNTRTKIQGSSDNKRLTFFVIFVSLRGIFELMKRLTVTLITVATMTHLKQDKSRFGYYACWGEIGSGLSLFMVGISLNYILHCVCGKQQPNYVIIFFFAVGFQFLTLGTLLFMRFEYHEHRVIDYQEVKKVLTDPHYVLILIICCHSGWCSAFQLRWEFWYMEELGGSSIVMAVGGLLRRPIVAVWFLMSPRIIAFFGELKVIALSLFIFAGSFVGLAFIENSWLIILFDNFQAASYVLSFASFVIHFSQVGSKASTAFFQGAVSLTFHGIGKEAGTAVTGYLFTTVGTKITLCSYSAATIVLLVIFLIYMIFANDYEGYKKLPGNFDPEKDDEVIDNADDAEDKVKQKE